MKSLILTVYNQNHIRRDWFVDLAGEKFRACVEKLAGELAEFGVALECRTNSEFTVDVNSYGDMLNVLRITSPADGVTSRCIGHIIGKSEHLDLFEDLRRAVNRVAFAPETIPPDDHNRKVCHNCGCGC